MILHKNNWFIAHEPGLVLTISLTLIALKASLNKATREFQSGFHGLAKNSTHMGYQKFWRLAEAGQSNYCQLSLPPLKYPDPDESEITLNS